MSSGLMLVLALLGPPEEVVGPSGSVGEPAIGPAEVSADSQPAVQRPAPPPDDAQLPGYDETHPLVEPADPPATDPPTTDPPADDALPTWESPEVDPANDPWAAPEMRPAKLPGEPRRGIGLLVLGSVGFAAIFTRQWVTQLLCADVYCGFRGNLDRIVLLGSMGVIGGGAWLEGRHRGFMRDHERKASPSLQGRRIAGWSMFAVGLAGMITEGALYMACYDGAKGPWVVLDGFAYTCRPAASVLMMDGSATLATVGFGLALSAQADRRQRSKPKSKLSLLPYAGPNRAGLSLVGRF